MGVEDRSPGLERRGDGVLEAHPCWFFAPGGERGALLLFLREGPWDNNKGGLREGAG